ncbi:hypothetical protein LSAT2_000930 [Lamellibrachia satsuma]|nr:hypothetical protein LSAT2_000930 [Lamellibrachia satsuma]
MCAVTSSHIGVCVPVDRPPGRERTSPISYTLTCGLVTRQYIGTSTNHGGFIYQAVFTGQGATLVTVDTGHSGSYEADAVYRAQVKVSSVDGGAVTTLSVTAPSVIGCSPRYVIVGVDRDGEWTWSDVGSTVTSDDDASVTHVACSPKSDHVAVLCDHECKVWIVSNPGGGDGVGGTFVSELRQRDSSEASFGGLVQVWNAEDIYSLHHVITGHVSMIRDMAFSPTGSYVTTVAVEMTLRVWDVRGGYSPKAVYYGPVNKLGFLGENELVEVKLSVGDRDKDVLKCDLKSVDVPPETRTVADRDKLAVREYDPALGLDATGNGCLISEGNMTLMPDGLGFSGCGTTWVLLVVLLATIQTYHKTSALGIEATGNGCLISEGNMTLIPDGLGFSGCGTIRVLLVVLLATIQTYHKTSGARCRFSSTPASQGSCIFPCRCTKGCNTTTGQCVNGGICEDGHPSGWKWTGTACQTGNVAYNKPSSQSIGSWGGSFPAGRAVDGNTNPSMARGHCAHPDTDWGRNAWWLVDLRETYNISRVIIFNRDAGGSGSDGHAHERLDTFKLSVGDSPDKTKHRQCASHNGRVAAGGTVEEQCKGIARYLSFKRDGGGNSYVTGLCEVVVIGHRHVECKECTTACNDVIGCDDCDPGKQQPDCVKDCDTGTYGKNCEEDCGHCKEKKFCDDKNGNCTSGCEAWYTSVVCKTYIHTPYFESTDKPKVDNIYSSSVTVRWPTAKNISPGLETHYYYIVWLQAEGKTYINKTKQSQLSNTDRFVTHISGLTFNTYYSVKVEPYRHQNKLREGGTSTGITMFKTNCIAPDIPIIENVTLSTQNGSTNGNIRMMWKTLNYSGCDQIKVVVVFYKLQNNNTWQHKEAERVSDTRLTLHSVNYDVYEVKVSARNNEDFTSTSETVIANFLTKVKCGPPPAVAHAKSRDDRVKISGQSDVHVNLRIAWWCWIYERQFSTIMVHKWTMAIDKELANSVVLLDLRKAFDLVNSTNCPS